MISAQELRTATHGGVAAEAVGLWLAEKLGAGDLAGLRSMDAQTITDGAAGRDFSRSSSSTAACCRARSSKCSIAASRRGCRCSRDSTAAKSARCASSRRQCPPMRRPTKRRSASATRDLADASSKLYPSGDLQESIWRRRATRCMAGPPSGWCAKQTAAGVPSFLYYFDHGYPAAVSEGPARLPCQRNSLCLRHRRQDAAELARKCRRRRVEAQLSDAMLELLGLVRARRRAERRGPAARGRPTAPSARTWLSKTRRGRRRICCPACTSSTSRWCAAAARRAASRGTGMSASPRRRCRAEALMQMIDGAMQPFALTLDKFLEHAAKWHPRAEVVTGRAGWARRSHRLCGAASAQPQGVGGAREFRRAHRRSRRDAGVEHAGACRSLVRDHGHGRGVPHAQSAPHLCAARGDGRRSPARACWSSAPTSRRWRGRSPRLRRRSNACCSSTERRISPSPRLADLAALALEPLIARAHGEVTWGGFDETAPCGLCFTSGTTGAPKGVTYTHRSSFLHTLRLLQADVMAISARDSVLAVVPMFHANAWGLPFAAPAAGAKLVLPGRQTDGAQPGRR